MDYVVLVFLLGVQLRKVGVSRELEPVRRTSLKTGSHFGCGQE